MTNNTNLPDKEFYDLVIRTAKKQINYHLGVVRDYKKIDLYIAEVNLNEAERHFKRLQEACAACGK
jgi:hypothetical protein